MDYFLAENETVDIKNEGRLRLRPFLMNILKNNSIPGVEWVDFQQQIFKLPWNRSGRSESAEKSEIFKQWAIHTGKYNEGVDTPDPAKWKTNLRCALHKAKDIKEMKDQEMCLDSHNPVKIYRFLPLKKKDAPMQPSFNYTAQEPCIPQLPTVIDDDEFTSGPVASLVYSREPSSHTDNSNEGSMYDCKSLNHGFSPKADMDIFMHKKEENYSGLSDLMDNIEKLEEIMNNNGISAPGISNMTSHSHDSQVSSFPSSVQPTTMSNLFDPRNVYTMASADRTTINTSQLQSSSYVSHVPEWTSVTQAVPDLTTLANSTTWRMSESSDDTHMSSLKNNINKVYSKFTGTPYNSHLCDSIEKSSMFLEIVYCGYVVGTKHVSSQSGLRVFCGLTPNDTKGLLEPKHQEEIFGPDFTGKESFEMPKWDTGLGSSKINDKGEEILQHCLRGFALECENGNIYLTRYCTTGLFTNSVLSGAEKIDRSTPPKKIKIFDLEGYFKPLLATYPQTKIKPSPDVCIHFGKKYKDSQTVVVMARVSSCEALQLLHELDETKEPSSVYLSKENDCDRIANTLQKMKINQN